MNNFLEKIKLGLQKSSSKYWIFGAFGVLILILIILASLSII